MAAALAGQAQPRLLDGVLGVGVRAQHAVRDRAQPVAFGFEDVGGGIAHAVTFLGSAPSWGMTGPKGLR